LFYNVRETLTAIVSNVNLFYVSFTGLGVFSRKLVLILVLALQVFTGCLVVANSVHRIITA